MTSFKEYLGEVKPVVDARILDIAGRKLKDEQLVRMLARGKRLRAGLLSLAFESTSGKRLDGAVDLACAVELAHSASLIIDDMIDEDEVRRGLPTVHKTEGQKRAMIDTVGILSLPYELAVPFGDGFVRSLAETQRGMASGVLKEVLANPELPATRIYDLIIRQKTGKPFGLASSWGYMAGIDGERKARDGHLQKWNNYGILVGKAMQIADDIADLEEAMRTKGVKGTGSELLLLRCVTAERLAKDLFSDIRKMTLHFEKVKELWTSEGVQESLRLKLQAEVTAAQELVRSLPVSGSNHRELLVSAPMEIAQIMLSEGR